MKEQGLLTQANWPRREYLHTPRVRYARVTARSPIYRPVTVVIVEKVDQERFYLVCLQTTILAPRLIHAWSRQSGETSLAILSRSCQAHEQQPNECKLVPQTLHPRARSLAVGLSLRSLGSSASRRASPSRLNPSTAMKMARPGKIPAHGARVTCP
jgi:hypothetical protein